MPLKGPDLPEPEWWKPARELYAMGLTMNSIATSLGVSFGAVKYALNPTYREANKAKVRAWQKKYPERVQHHGNRKRDELRRAARDEWRENGRVGSLYDQYRKWDCA